MALTKVTGQVIKNTTDVTVGVLTVTNTLAVGGTVSIGGTLTYEDVTNIDSVGLVTARNGIVVGSGITLSKDGDGFFTGIVTATTFSGSLAASNLTGALPAISAANLTNVPAANITGTLPAISGANLTNLDASDLASGTVPTARLGSGTASSSTFLRGDSTFQTVNTDLVSDTSPQLGGDLASNGHDLKFADASGYDGNQIYMGSDNDVRIHHDGSNFSIAEATGDVTISAADDIFLKPQASEDGIKVIGNGAVELYYDNSKKFETITNGCTVTGRLNVTDTVNPVQINLSDNRKIKLGDSDDLEIYHNASHSIIHDNGTGDLKIIGDDVIIQADNDDTMAKFIEDGAVELYHDNSKKLQTASHGVDIFGLLQVQGNCAPSADNTYDLGTSSERWRNLYTTDLQLSNEGKVNDVDGTWGNYTIQEGESDLFLINNRSGKKYKFNLTEVS